MSFKYVNKSVTTIFFYPLYRTLGVYTSSHNSSSLVISGTGRTVYSNPASPKSTFVDALKVNKSNISYSDSQLPLPVSVDSTVVIPDGNHSAYCNASSSSNLSLVMAGMGGNGSFHDDDLPNEACNSRNMNLDKLHARMLLSQQACPVDPLQGSDIYFQGPPRNNLMSEFLSDSVDVSVLADSNSAEIPGQGLILNGGGGGASSMVTGVGGGGGGGGGTGSMDMLGQAPLQYNPQSVFEDLDVDNLLRELEVVQPPSASDLGIPDPDIIFKDMAMGSVLMSDPLSTPVNGDFINGFSGISIQPVQAAGTLVTSVPMQPGNSGISVQAEDSATGDHFDIIKMMNVQLKPSAPASLGLKESNLLVPKSHIPSPLDSKNAVPPSPTTPYTPNPPTPMAPVQASAPSPPPPATPQTPKTPCTTQKGPFKVETYTEDEKRVVKVGIQKDLPVNQKFVAIQAASFSWEVNCKVQQCLKCPCDLKVAIDAQAELCESKCDPETAQLIFSMPKNCKSASKLVCVCVCVCV